MDNVLALFRYSAVLAACVVVAACGGGGGGGASAPTASTATTTANGVGSCGLNGSAGIQDEILQRVNALRAKGATCGSQVFLPTTPLTWNGALFQAALAHSQDMASQNYFSHDSLDGRTMGVRIKNAGYQYSYAGENIAAGQVTVQEVMDAWTTSSGHCKNMLNPNYKEIGVACVNNSKSTYDFYWTMDLGSK